MNHKALESNLENLLKHYPKEQVLAYYPRRIITPMEYLNPKYFSALCFRFIYYNHMLGTTPTQQELQDVNDCEYFLPVLTEKMMPTYFLAREFLESVEQTDIPEDFTFSQLHFPMPGFLFVLPDQFTTQSVTLNIPFVMVSTYQGLLYIQPFAVADNGEFKRFSICLKYEGAQESIQAFINLNVTAQKQCDSSEFDNDFYIYSLVLKVLLIISTQPRALVDLLDEPPVRRQRIRHNGRISNALWNPTFIGKGYSTQRLGGGNGIGSGMRMHWRRGHLRNQRYGPNRSLVAVVWIKPVLIHRELLESANSSVNVN